MKKQSLTVLIAILVMLQLYSLSKISTLQTQIERVNYTANSAETHLQSQISEIYQNVDQKLEKQASLILRAYAQVGKLNGDTIMVPVTFTVSPKTVTDTMSVSLDIDGETLPLVRSGLEYSATKEFEISKNIFPTIVLEDSGEKHVEEHEGLMLANLKEMIFPEVYAYFSGESSCGSNEYREKGQLQVDCKPSQENNGLTDIKYVVRVDGETVKETPVPLGQESGMGGTFEIDIDNKYSLGDGQILTAHVVAVDSLGFTHEYQVLYFVGGADAQREPDFRQEKIIAPNGETVYRYDEEENLEFYP